MQTYLSQQQNQANALQNQPYGLAGQLGLLGEANDEKASRKHGGRLSRANGGQTALEAANRMRNLAMARRSPLGIANLQNSNVALNNLGRGLGAPMLRKDGGKLKRDDGGQVSSGLKGPLNPNWQTDNPFAGGPDDQDTSRMTDVPKTSQGTPYKDSYGRTHNFKGGGKLSAKQRQSLPKSDFALPGHGKGPKGAGAGSYPINDKSHARNALARVAQHGTSAEKARVSAKVHAKYPDIGKK